MVHSWSMHPKENTFSVWPQVKNIFSLILIVFLHTIEEFFFLVFNLVNFFMNSVFVLFRSFSNQAFPLYP